MITKNYKEVVFKSRTMTNEIGENNYRKLLYYYSNRIIVHFKDLDKIFYNGLIVDLNEEKLTMILKERVRGEIPVLLECIDSNSIEAYKIKDGSGWE